MKKLISIEEWNENNLPPGFGKEWKQSGIACPKCGKELSQKWTSDIYVSPTGLTYQSVYCVLCRYSDKVIKKETELSHEVSNHEHEGQTCF